MQQDTAPDKTSETVVSSGWDREGEYVVVCDDESSDNYEKPRWKGVFGLDGSMSLSPKSKNINIFTQPPAQ